MTPAKPIRIRIRRVDYDDHADDIAEINTARFIGRQPSPSHLYWIAFHDDYPVAFASARPSQQWDNAVYLSLCVVRKEYGGLGIQRRLLRVRENWARRAGYSWIVTDTTDNPPSANNLIRRGYTTFTPSAPWAFRHSIYWNKRVV